RYLSIFPTFRAILFSSSAASAAAKNRTIRPQGKTVNTFSGIFLGKFVMSLSDKVFYLRQTLRRLQQPPSSPPADAPL
ncbi:hypothetical protein, partial [Neisseria gonorrhoeae]|uniref:hypothetical protein n=3 Tax=Neisseria gonorrhoeae TaxID=485 RepID=UPI001E5E4EC4